MMVHDRLGNTLIHGSRVEIIADTAVDSVREGTVVAVEHDVVFIALVVDDQEIVVERFGGDLIVISSKPDPFPDHDLDFIASAISSAESMARELSLNPPAYPYEEALDEIILALRECQNRLLP